MRIVTDSTQILAIDLDRMQLISGVRPPAKTVKFTSDVIDHLALDDIVELMLNGHGLSTICRYVDHLPSLYMVTKWRQADSDVDALIERARKEGASTLADETQLIADTDIDSSRAKNRIQTRQWLAERRNPAKYSQKIDINMTHRINPTEMRQTAIDRARSMRDQLTQWADQVIDSTVVPDTEARDCESSDLIKKEGIDSLLD